MIKKLSVRFFLPFIISVLLFLVWEFTPLGGVSQRFIKAASIFDYYPYLFFSLLALVMLFQQIRYAFQSWKLVILRGLLSGYIVSILALLISELLIADGIGRVSNTLNAVGLPQWFLLQLLISISLAGWLYGFLALAMVKLWEKML